MTSLASRTKERAKKSTPASIPTAISSLSLLVRAGRLTLTPGRLM